MAKLFVDSGGLVDAQNVSLIIILGKSFHYFIQYNILRAEYFVLFFCIFVFLFCFFFLQVSRVCKSSNIHSWC